MARIKITLEMPVEAFRTILHKAPPEHRDWWWMTDEQIANLSIVQLIPLAQSEIQRQIDDGLFNEVLHGTQES